MAKRRPSGDGMVRRREDGRWEGRIVVGHKNNGDSIFRYTYARTQKELTAKLRQEAEAYQGVDLTEHCTVTLGEWLDQWLDHTMAAVIRPSTLNGYRRYAALIKSQLGDKQLTHITQADVQKAYNYLKEHGRQREDPVLGHKLSDAVIRSVHGVLYGAMKAAEHAHLIPRNPTIGVTVPNANHAPKQILNEQQLGIFMDEIEKDAIWRDFFYTAITTGLRRGEICGLRWEDFDETDGTLKIQRTIRKETGGVLISGETKTEQGNRSITLAPSTAERLRQRRKSSRSEWIFHDPLHPELPVSPHAAYGRLKVILKSAGLPNLRFHDIRHTFATHALANGVDAKTLSAILGHTKASFTLDTYTHVTGDMQKRAAEIVGDFMTEIFGEEMKPWGRL